MEKLTQFVSTSFENNNNSTKVSDQCLQSKLETDNFSPQPIKTEKELSHHDDAKKPKNWLISDIEDNSDNSTAVGIDLRLNSSRVLSNVKCNEQSDVSGDKNCFPKKPKWCENKFFVKTPTENCASGEHQNSKSCIDVFDKSSNDQENTCEENENKMCKSKIFQFYVSCMQFQIVE